MATISSTPLTQWHRSQNARMADFAGYDMPIQYSGIVFEHIATRTAAGLFDISHMGRLRFEGPRADQLLDHVLTRRVLDMKNGQVRYSLICNEEGGVLDDVLVSCLESPSGRGEYFLLVVNASNRDKIVRWLQPHLADFPDVTMTDVTDQTAMIAIQGPKAMEICKPLFQSSIENLGYYKSRVTQQMGKPTIISRTGYTGEDGLELIVKAEDAMRVWENILLSGRDLGVTPVGLGARDTLRLEAGMPLYGHELDETVNPYQADLGFAVSLKERSFIGSEAMTSLQSTPSKQKRVGLLIEGMRAARQGAAVLDPDLLASDSADSTNAGSTSIGLVTSGSHSPTLNRPIAMAYIDRFKSAIGSKVVIDVRGAKVQAEICSYPFYTRKST
ncbi:MAG: glycine cleavage system aminomethyltransferase GcvT [Planctomycetota bacterium]|nr:glycine cleavage system aminomethyltransferase GcvT [Planctomycetota bacterium]